MELVNVTQEVGLTEIQKLKSACYSGIKHNLPERMPITVLHIGEEQSAVASGSRYRIPAAAECGNSRRLKALSNNRNSAYTRVLTRPILSMARLR